MLLVLGHHQRDALLSAVLVGMDEDEIEAGGAVRGGMVHDGETRFGEGVDEAQLDGNREHALLLPVGGGGWRKGGAHRHVDPRVQGRERLRGRIRCRRRGCCGGGGGRGRRWRRHSTKCGEKKKMGCKTTPTCGRQQQWPCNRERAHTSHLKSPIPSSFPT